MVLLPACLATFNKTRGASLRKRLSCHSSGSRPTERANSTRSSGTIRRRDGRRSRRREISRLSDAVLTLELLYLGGQLVGLLDLALESDEVLESPVALNHHR